MVLRTPRVAIWRTEWLSGSETFVANQASHLTTWTPAPLTLRHIESVLSTRQATLLFEDGRFGDARRYLFNRGRRSRSAQKTLRALDVDLVHAHFGPDAAIIAPTVRAVGLPLVATFHGFDVTSLPQSSTPYARAYREWLPSLFETATTLIAVSDFVASRLRILGAPEDKIVVHHIGVEIGDAGAAGNADGPILFVGRLVEKKGLDDLLEAMAALPSSLRSRAVEVIGDGPLKAGLEAKARLLNLRVDFLGQLPPASVRERMRGAAIFAAPSKTAASGDSEGLPTTIQEAGALGLPIVSTTHAGIPDVVRHEDTGLLGPEGDIGALTQNIERLLRNPTEAWHLGKRAKSHVEENFNVITQTLRLEALYDSAAASRQARPFPAA